MGSPTGIAASGTAEEIEQFRSAGKPVMLYFSSVALPPGDVDHQQYQALNDYRKSLSSAGLYFEYKTSADFRQMFQAHLSRLMYELLSKSNHPSGSLDSLLDGAQDELSVHKHLALVMQKWLLRSQKSSALRSIRATKWYTA
jgi:hypothetical protein